jgi:hypothetical protein
LAEILYCILGNAIAKFYRTPEEVERFFKMSLIRTKTPTNGSTKDAYLLDVTADSSAIADLC